MAPLVRDLSYGGFCMVAVVTAVVLSKRVILSIPLS